jgi:hypothetical protein
MAVIVAAYLIVWIPLVLAGRQLGRAWGNPEAGFWLPALTGLLGFVLFVTGSHPATRPRREIGR